MSLVSIFNLFPTATYFTYIVKLVLTSIANPPPPPPLEKREMNVSILIVLAQIKNKIF